MQSLSRKCLVGVDYKCVHKKGDHAVICTGCCFSFVYIQQIVHTLCKLKKEEDLITFGALYSILETMYIVLQTCNIHNVYTVIEHVHCILN